MWGKSELEIVLHKIIYSADLGLISIQQSRKFILDVLHRSASRNIKRAAKTFNLRTTKGVHVYPVCIVSLSPCPDL